MTRRIKRNETFVNENINFDEYKGILFKSYGQAKDSTVIFTMDPDTARFYATDRKLAEHMDFVPYLGRSRDHLLRGEFNGDVMKAESALVLGVWSVKSIDDLRERLMMIRKGAQQFLEMGLKKDKRISFYTTTFNLCDSEIDTFKTTTLEVIASMTYEELDEFIVTSEKELVGLVFAE
jgi:hypothetical protein